MIVRVAGVMRSCSGIGIVAPDIGLLAVSCQKRSERWRLWPVSTETSTLMPAAGDTSVGPPVILMRTGMRCTTFTQLPEEFSAGSSENCDPEAGATLCTTPVHLLPG